MKNRRLSKFKYDRRKFKSKHSKLSRGWIKFLTCPESDMLLRLLGWHLFPIKILMVSGTCKGQTWYLDHILKRRTLSANKYWMTQRNHRIHRSVCITNLTDYKQSSKLSWTKVLWPTWPDSFSRSNKNKKARHKTRLWAQVQKNLNLNVLHLWMKLQRVTAQKL